MGDGSRGPGGKYPHDPGKSGGSRPESSPGRLHNHCGRHICQHPAGPAGRRRAGQTDRRSGRNPRKSHLRRGIEPADRRQMAGGVRLLVPQRLLAHGNRHRIPAGHAPRHRLPRHRVRDRGVQPREPPDQRQLGAVLRTPQPARPLLDRGEAERRRNRHRRSQRFRQPASPHRQQLFRPAARLWVQRRGDDPHREFVHVDHAVVHHHRRQLLRPLQRRGGNPFDQIG